MFKKWQSGDTILCVSGLVISNIKHKVRDAKSETQSIAFPMFVIGIKSNKLVSKVKGNESRIASTVNNSFISLCTFIVSKMQLRKTGIPLPYSVAFLELISHRSISTMRMLRLPPSFSFPSVSIGLDTLPIPPFLCTWQGGDINPIRLDYLVQAILDPV